MEGVIDRVEWYEALLAEDPTSPTFAELAELLYEDGRYEEVLSVCTRGMGAHPFHLKGQLYLGLSLFHLDRREEAERVFMALRRELQPFSKLFTALAMRAVELGESEDAERLLHLAQAIGAGTPPPPYEKEERESVAPNRTERLPSPAASPEGEVARGEPLSPPPSPSPRRRLLEKLACAVEELLSHHPVPSVASQGFLDEADRALLVRYLLSRLHPSERARYH